MVRLSDDELYRLPMIMQADPTTRRHLVNEYGLERYVQLLGVLVDDSSYGRLWRVFQDDDEDIAVVEVTNSTPGPDGSSEVFFLRVPPWAGSARAAVAWTFGLADHEYVVAQQT